MIPRTTFSLLRKVSSSTASSSMWHSRGMDSSVIGRTDEEHDLLRIDARDDDAEETIDDSRDDDAEETIDDSRE
jgi:hypothetical protein